MFCKNDHNCCWRHTFKGLALDTIKCDKFHQKFVLLTNFEAIPESQLQLAVLGMNSLIMRLDANATDTAATDIYGGGTKNADWARRMELFLGSHDYLCFAV
jgi:hypothetical protein